MYEGVCQLKDGVVSIAKRTQVSSKNVDDVLRSIVRRINEHSLCTCIKPLFDEGEESWRPHCQSSMPSDRPAIR